MICNLIRLIAFAQLLAFCSAKCDAAVIWEYDLTNLGATRSLGNSFSLAKNGLVDGGVSFNATLVITANALSGLSEIGYQQLGGTSGGFGVVGTQLGGNTLNGNAGAESLRFTLLLSNIMGGSVIFNGFSIVDFNGYGINDRGVLSADNDFLTGADNTDLGPGGLPSAAVPSNPSAFSIFSNSTNQFQVSAVTGSFTGVAAAVPEPSATVGLVLGAAAVPLLRRFRRRANSVDSESLVA
jgi:hypothetical protein